jgi:hypothetical protein
MANGSRMMQRRTTTGRAWVVISDVMYQLSFVTMAAKLEMRDTTAGVSMHVRNGRLPLANIFSFMSAAKKA